MIARFTRKRHSAIGVDIGSRSVKLVQLSSDHGRLVEASRVDVPISAENPPSTERLAQAMKRAREGRNFRGRDVVICLNDHHLFLQNIRIPKLEPPNVDRAIHHEAAGRVPFPVAEAEIRYLEAADIRHGDNVMREVILMACHRPILDKAIEVVEAAGLHPVAVDVEPAALLRSYVAQFRREQDSQERAILVNIGYGSTAVVIAKGDEILFVKYINLGGRSLDEAVGRSLKMEVGEASTLRRHNGDRRSDRQDPEIASTVGQAIRPTVERLATELSMCVRYHSITFRGRPLSRLVLSGGEATQEFCDALNKRLGIKCELSDPFRVFPTATNCGRRAQWDVATGLAMRA